MTTGLISPLMQIPVEELRQCARVRFRLTKDIPSLIEDFAQSIVEEVRSNNKLGKPTRFILPVGPTAQYKRVAEICNRERISWKNVYSFNMDEFLDWQSRPLPLSHPLSFEGFMRREFFSKLNEEIRIPEDHCFFPNPSRLDEISEKIQEFGGVDCCYGGVGYHGHIAFNDPPNTRWMRITVEQLRNSLTRIIALGHDSIVVQSINSAGGDSSAIPPMAVTIGMKDILDSRKVRLYLAGGERHRAIFRTTLAGEVNTDYPSTLVQGHPDAEVITDEATARPIYPGL